MSGSGGLGMGPVEAGLAAMAAWGFMLGSSVHRTQLALSV